MPTRTISMFEDQRLTLEDSIDLTRQSLLAYGMDYRHWAIAYSGGKDSTATVATVVHLIETQQIPRPTTLFFFAPLNGFSQQCDHFAIQRAGILFGQFD